MSTGETQDAVRGKPSSPSERAAGTLIWMFITPYFISRTVALFWMPMTYWQAFIVLWAVVLVLGHVSRAIRGDTRKYEQWYFDRQDRLAALEARHDG